MKEYSFYCVECKKAHTRKVLVSQVRDLQSIERSQLGAMVMIPCEEHLSKALAKSPSRQNKAA